jgi:hypothetical protein
MGKDVEINRQKEREIDLQWKETAMNTQIK